MYKKSIHKIILSVLLFQLVLGPVSPALAEELVVSEEAIVVSEKPILLEPAPIVSSTVEVSPEIVAKKEEIVLLDQTPIVEAKEAAVSSTVEVVLGEKIVAATTTEIIPVFAAITEKSPVIADSNTDEVFSFNKAGVSEESADGGKFRVVDSLYDEAIIGDKKVLRIYKEPRLIYKDKDNSIRIHAKGWNLFGEKPETKLKSKSEGGYSFDYKLNSDNLVQISSGPMEFVGGEKIINANKTNWESSAKDQRIVNQANELYSGVDIAFYDSGLKRQRVLTIKQKPDIDYKTVDQLVFWENYNYPTGSILLNWDDTPLLDGSVIDVSPIKIKVPSGDTMMINPAMMFDGTNEEISTAPAPYLIKIDTANNTLSLGIQVSTAYLNDPRRVYPVTIDPTYYACTGLNELGCTGYLDYYYRQEISASAPVDDRLPVANASSFSGAGLYEGLYSVSATEKYVREIGLIFPSGIINKISTYGNITSAKLFMRYLGKGLGSYSGTTVAISAKTPGTSCSTLNNIMLYRNVASCGYSTSVQTTVTVSPANAATYSWNITSSVADWVVFPNDNKGIILESTSTWDGKLSKTNFPNWPNLLSVFKASEDSATYSGNDPYLEVAVAPQYPDLTDGGSNGSTSVAAGGTLAYNIIEKNQGVVTAGPHNIRLWEGSPANGCKNSVVSNYSVSSLVVGPTITYQVGGIQLSVPSNTVPGTYCLLNEYDSGGTVAESNETNNSFIFNYTVTAPTIPDLIGFSGTPSNGTNVTVGQQITLGATVKNNGNAMAGPSSLRFYLDYGAASFTTPITSDLAMNSIGASGQGSITGVTYSTSGLLPGTYYLGYKVDSLNAVSEGSSGEANNNFSIGTIIVTQPNDIAATALSFNNTRTYTSGNNDTISFSATLKNNTSNVLSNVPYRIRLLQNGGGVAATLGSISPATLSFSANGTQTITVTGLIPAGMPTAYYFGQITLDPAQTLAETNISNNIFQTSGTVLVQTYYSSGGGGGSGGTPGNVAVYTGTLNTPVSNPAATLASTNIKKLTTTQSDQINGASTADPVNARTGAFEFAQTDFTLPGRGAPIDFKRTYNSKLAARSARFGNGWSSSYDSYYFQDPATKNVQVYLGGALASFFTTSDGGATFVAEKGDPNTLTVQGAGLTYQVQNGIKYVFSLVSATNLGTLDKIVDTFGNETVLQYTSVLNVPLLTSVTDPSGRKIIFSYPVDTADPKWDKVSQMSEVIGGVTLVDNQYFYDSSTTIGFNLTKVIQNRRYQGQTETITHLFEYDINGQLVKYTNPLGTKLFTDYEAGATGRVIKQWEGNEPKYGVGDKRVIYNLSYTDVADPTVAGSAHCTQTQNYRDASNHYDEYVCFNSDELKIYSKKGVTVDRWTYDTNGMPATFTDGVGNVTSYTYDSLRRLTKQILPDTSAWHTEVAYQYAKDPFNWISQKNETAKDLATNQVASRITTYAINLSNGQINSITYPLNFSETFTYNANGTVSSFVDKNLNATAYTYDPTSNFRASESVVVANVDGVSHAVVKQFAYDIYGNAITVVDGNGKTTTNIYDTQKNLRQSTDPLGTVATYSYDLGDHRISQSILPTVGPAHVVNFNYDTDLNATLLKVTKVKVTATADIINSRAYDYVGNVVSETDPNGIQTNFTYDSANRVIGQGDPIKIITKEYFDNDLVKKEIVANPANPSVALKRTDYIYDSRGNKIEEDRFSDATNFVALKWSYDGFNRVIKQTDGNGNDTLFGYDGLNRLVASTDPLGNITTYSYDGNGNKTGVLLPRAQTDASLRNSLGQSTTFAYDALGRQIKQVNAGDKITKQYFDDVGNITKVIDRQNSDGTNNTHVTQFSYDALNHQIGTIFANGTTASSAYDGYGNVSTKLDQAGRTTAYVYDEFNRLKSETDNSGAVTSYTYDAAGNKKSVVYPDTTNINFGYDAANRLITATDIQNGQRVYTYDALGNKLTDQDKLGRVTTALYDQLSRLVSETNPAGTVTSYAYDKNNNRTSESVAGRPVVYEYDKLNRSTLVFESGTGLRKTYTYDADSNQKTVTGKRNELTQYGYDKLGRMITKQLPLGYLVTYQYDNWNNILNLVDENDTTTHTYDVLNQPLVETKKFPSFIAPYAITRVYAADGQLSALTDAAGRTFNYVYDSRGLLQTVSLSTTTLARYTYNSVGKTQTITYGNGVVTTYGYDTLNRVVSIETKSGAGMVLFRQAYTYDAENNRTRLLSLNPDDSSNVATTYAYDALGQLTDVDYENVDGVGTDLTYRYDIYGNRTTSGSPTDIAAYAYNTNSNLLAAVTYNSQLTVTSQYDESGSLQQEAYTRAGKADKTVDYWWDDRDRLVDITYTHQSQNAFMPAHPVDDVRFAYDDNNNRIAKIVGFTDSISPANCQSAIPTNCQITFYINSGLSVQNEVDGQGAVTKSIVRGLEQIAEIDPVGTVTYVQQDVLGSAVLLTDQSGVVIQRYEYDPFGQIIGQDGSADTKYTYTGQEYDGESELYYYNARYYNPGLGRFISRDPFLGRAGDSLSRNGYNYVKNNPLKYVDPSGEVTIATQAQLQSQQMGWVEKTLLSSSFQNGLKTISGVVDPVWDIISFGSFDNIQKSTDDIKANGANIYNTTGLVGNIVGGVVVTGGMALSIGTELGGLTMSVQEYLARNSVQSAMSQPVQAPEGYKWSQPKYSPNFSNPPESSFPYKGMPVEDVAVKVKVGEVNFSELSSYTIERNGTKYIYDSRSSVTPIVAGSEPNLVPLTPDAPSYNTIMNEFDKRMIKYGEQGFDTIIKSNGSK